MAKSLAIDIGGTRIKIALMENGKVLRDTFVDAKSEGLIRDRLPQVVSAAKKRMGEDLYSCEGVGIALPCLVDEKMKRATEIYQKFIDAPDIDFRRWAEEMFHLPVAVEQDSKAALIGEACYGEAVGEKDVLMVILGTGVGTAVMMNGDFPVSRNHAAGGLGSHMIIHRGGRKCTCPSRGCLEAYVGGWALPGIIKTHPIYAQSCLSKEQTLDYKALGKALNAGDTVAQDIMSRIVEDLRAGLVSLIHAYSPRLVLLSGGPVNLEKELVEPVFHELHNEVWGSDAEILCKKAKFPDHSVLMGLHGLVCGDWEKRRKANDAERYSE